MRPNPLEQGVSRRSLIRSLGATTVVIGSPLLSSCLIDAESKARIDARSKDPAAAGAASNKVAAGSARKEPTRVPDRLSLKPEDLYRALLTTPLKSEEVPPGFVVEKGPYSNFSSDPRIAALLAQRTLAGRVAEPFKPVGNVVFELKDPFSSSNHFLSYLVFSNTKDAETTFQALLSQPNMRKTNILNLPAVIYASTGPSQVTNLLSAFTIVLAQNTVIQTGFEEIFYFGPQAEAENKVQNGELHSIMLAQAGIKHLQRVGSPR